MESRKRVASLLILFILSKNPLSFSMSESLPLDPAEFTPRFDAAARRAGFRPERFGEVHGHPLLAYTKRTPGRRPRIYLSAGIHGDEPAPPQALLRLIGEGFFDDRCTWFICPLLNPTGFAARTRENHERTDLNRDFKNTASKEIRAHIAWLERQPNFDLTLCVHEDWEASGYYLYELNPESRPTLAHAMIAAAASVGLIETATVIDGREVAEPGVIRPVSDPLLRELWPESIYLRRHHSRLSYTTETPSALPLEQRIAMHCAALKAAVGEFLR
ncbi:MAG: Succinylglutamate desuccinylase / Aspartoacylase family protein [Lacunisphaera sp.]|nr:Succinylglutamate desuccinylase / Aspartoacylase family protein [Lacunisphaera sp.]